MRISQKILLLYSTAMGVFVVFGAMSTGLESGNWLPVIIFSPVLLYFILIIIAPNRKFRGVLVYNFILTTVMTAAGFLGAKSLPQFVSASLFLPLALCFWQQILPKKSVIAPTTDLGFEILTIPEEPATKLQKAPHHYDIDRRTFLKLIGSAGLTLFLFSVFTKRAEATFFGSVPGPGTVALKDSTGAAIDPAIKQPTDGYKISEVDADSSPAYYGYLEKTGKWFIMKEEDTGAYRYTRGDTDFAGNWTDRDELEYDYYDAVF